MGIALPPPGRTQGGTSGVSFLPWGIRWKRGGSDQRTTLFLKKSVEYKMKILGKIDIKYTK